MNVELSSQEQEDGLMTDIFDFLTQRYGDLYAQEVGRSIVTSEGAGPHEAACPGHGWRLSDEHKDLVSEGLYEHITHSHDVGRLIGAVNMVLHLHRTAHYCRPRVGADDSVWFETGDACGTLRALARIHADHADYDKAWW